MSRVWNVVRIQLVNAPAVLAFPIGILALVFVTNLGIFAVLGDTVEEHGRITGGLISIYIVMLTVHLQTMTQVFSFALGLSVTRRTFFAATVVVVAAQSLGYGIVLYLLRVLEDTTGGWGLGLRFFGLPFAVEANPILQIIVYTVPFLLMSFLGVWTGIVFKRWGQPGVYTLAIGTAALGALFFIVATWQEWWPAVGRFFADQTPIGLFGGYSLALAALLACAGYLTIRRATP
ncbi:hypothetical protein SAMN05216266_1295 [Amycolatopsis marina]|uniref:ABC-2 type transport system permease protein n=1 Tax=Amycolatopsis marina TaxID=490629 RepID=A0A1I1CGJ6_9PSEU|nr:hypothetical protein [Amycolatopsis marina]SFB61815.1 hypothetical protein SAMN05216266_1295 [Amycolatopsis marina]